MLFQRLDYRRTRYLCLGGPSPHIRGHIKTDNGVHQRCCWWWCQCFFCGHWTSYNLPPSHWSSVFWWWGCQGSKVASPTHWLGNACFCATTWELIQANVPHVIDSLSEDYVRWCSLPLTDEKRYICVSMSKGYAARQHVHVVGCAPCPHPCLQTGVGAGRAPYFFPGYFKILTVHYLQMTNFFAPLPR